MKCKDNCWDGGGLIGLIGLIVKDADDGDENENENEDENEDEQEALDDVAVFGWIWELLRHYLSVVGCGVICERVVG